MKKFLALVLALVMTMSLVTISAGAEDFTDDSKITYEEAVDVMTAIGVVGGYADGSFNPQGTLTRGAAAKIICNMILGPTEAGALATVEAPFSDVPADHVFSGYIAYCVSEGIVSGYSDGTFRPAGTLTGYAFMKMLLGALGYDADIEGYTGANFSINVAKRALNLGLDDGLVGSFAGSKALTREEACLYAFNTLKATMVKYNNKNTITIGDIVISNTSDATDRTDGNVNGLDNLDNNSTLEFAEEYFAKLGYVASSVTDVFNRPAHTWSYDKKDIGTYSSTPVAVFTGKTKAADVASALKGYYAKATDGTFYAIENTNDRSFSTDAIVTIAQETSPYKYTQALSISSETVAEALADETKNGLKIELFSTKDATSGKNYISAVAVTWYAVGKVTAISTNAAGDISYTIDNIGGLKDWASEDKTDSIKLHGEIAKNDFVTWAIDNKGVYHIYTTEKFVGTQSAFNTDKLTLTIDGTIYDVANGVANATVDGFVSVDEFPNTDKEYNYFVDQFGYVVKSDAVAAETKYAVINNIAKVNGLSDSVQAELIFADATTEVVTVKKFVGEDGAEKTITATSGDDLTNASYRNVVCTYEIKDGKYELTAVPTALSGIKSANVSSSTTAVSTKGNPVVAGVPVTNNETTFVVKTLSGTSAAYNTYVGYQNVPTIAGASSKTVYVDYATNADGVVKFVYINAYSADSVTNDASKGDVVFITSTQYTTERISDTLTVYHYAAIINGEAGTITTKGTVDSNATALTKALYKVTVTEDGYAKTLVAQATAAGSGDDYYLYGTLNASTSTNAASGVITINGTVYTYDGTETVTVIDKDGNVTVGTMDMLDIKTNTADYNDIYVKEVDNTTAANEIASIYVITA